MSAWDCSKEKETSKIEIEELLPITKRFMKEIMRYIKHSLNLIKEHTPNGTTLELTT